MSVHNRNDESSIFVEYCRSCDTHNWCTHHDEAKYHETFLKLNEMVARRMPQLEVIGNMMPTHLIPFKIAQNKYVDANTNKYVVYPQIGSFEVTFRGRVIFSKKESHTWPNLPSILSKISSIIDPDYQSPSKQSQPQQEDRQTSKVLNNNSFLDSEEDKKTNYKSPQKGFTLTDHFKMYRPKNHFEEKDWLTEKQESQASIRQISEMGRLQSREKSDKKSQKSVQSKKSSDIVGETKLKEMLKHKTMINKDSGKKEMFIRLDSIEQENIIEQAAPATQRTQQKNVKKNNKMKQIDDQINQLDTKFKNFETRVHEIQSRNQQFEMKSIGKDDKNMFKQTIQGRQEEMERKASVKNHRQSSFKERQAREKAFADKTNKLEQYLNYSQQEKNDKLHRIYGEWKLIKQFNKKNKKFLRGKSKGDQQQQLEESESESRSKAYSRSQSPNSFGNIITFKHKNQKKLQRKIKNLINQKQHKHSSVQIHNNISSQLAKDTRNQTDGHFYNNRKFLKPRVEMQSETEIIHSYHPVSKLIKKSVNTLSMNALKSLANNQSNLHKIQSETNSVQNFSASAKANINKISNRISNIQQKLKNHNNNPFFEPILESPYADRSRNYSKKSHSKSGSQHNPSMKKLNKIYKGNNNQRNSNTSGNTVKKNFSQDKFKNTNFSQVDRPQTKKINEKLIKEQEQQPNPHQSKRKPIKYFDENEEDPIVYSNNSPKKTSKNSNNRMNSHNNNGSGRKVSKSKDSQIRNSKGSEGRRQKQTDKLKQLKESESKQPEISQRKILKEKRSTQQLGQNQSHSDFKRAFRDRKVRDHRLKRRIQNQDSRKQAQIIEYDEESEQQHSNQHQYEYHPHQARQPKPLQRKLKEWRQSSPTTNILKSKQIIKPQGINKKIRESDSKQTVVRSKKLKKNQIDNNKSIVSSNQEEIQNNSEVLPAEETKVRSGQIKRNRLANQSIHKDSKQRVYQELQKKSQIKKGQIRNQYEYNVPASQRSEENEDAEGAEQFSYNESQKYRQPSNRFSSENEYHSINNYQRSENSSKVSGVNDEKLRKTLGYFKVNELCYRGVKTSQENRQGDNKIKKADKASLYETQRNNDQSWQQEVQQGHQNQVQQAEDASNHQQNQDNCSQSSESQFVPECKKKNETLQRQKEDTEQGWKNKSQDSQNQMLPQEVQQIQSEKNVRKNSLQQKLEKQQAINDEQEESKQADNAHEVKSQQVYNQNEYSKDEVMRPQTTQEFCNFQTKQIQESNSIDEKKQEKCEQVSKNEAILASSSVVKRSESKAKQQSKKKKHVNLDMIVSKEYSEYLSCKISSQLSKVQSKANEAPQNMENTEEKATVTIEVTNTQGFIDGKNEEQQPQIGNFMDFQPQKPVILQENNEEIEQGQNQNEECPEQCAQQAQQQKINEVQEVQNADIEKQQTKSDAKNDKKCQSQKQNITIPIVNGFSNNVSITKQTSDAQKSPIATESPPQVSATQPNPAPSNQNNILKFKPFQDNVYSQSKAQNLRKFTQIGVQKQLTLQVSIQTDSTQYNDNVIMTKNINFTVAEESAKKSSRQATPQHRENVLSQYDGTIRNNYLNDTKSSFYGNRTVKEPIRAKITNQILSLTREKEMQKFSSVILGNDYQILKEQGAVTKLSAVYPQGVFMSERSLQVEQIKTKFPKFFKVLQILAERGEWILTRLFQDPKGLLQERVFGVWLCLNFQWQCLVIDDCIKTDESNLPLFTYHSGNQKWSNILQKALASVLGGYQNLQRASCSEIFTLLTGCNAIGVKVKQDPSKNGKLLQLISESQRKNYIVHAQKHWERNKEQRDSIYYVLSVRRSNSEEQALLELSQDGRENFWMRLSKFTQEFSRVEILQLRVNHNFTHIDLGTGKQNQLTVIELAFAESGQGCVTLTYIDHSGPLTAYLYREEKSRVLKLVGQAREKQKTHLFFECNFSEGRYYVFSETKERPARLAYYGQNGPSLKITEEIHNDGLKNEVAEYLPIGQTKLKSKRQMEQTWNDWKGKTPRLKDNFMQSKLRQNFVEYILGHKKKEGNEC